MRNKVYATTSSLIFDIRSISEQSLRISPRKPAFFSIFYHNPSPSGKMAESSSSQDSSVSAAPGPCKSHFSTGQSPTPHLGRCFERGAKHHARNTSFQSLGRGLASETKTFTQPWRRGRLGYFLLKKAGVQRAAACFIPRMRLPFAGGR